MNTFAPSKRDIAQLNVLGHRGIESLCFERRCSSGLKGTPPTLDVLLSGQSGIVGIESKCLEYFGAHTAHFADVYLSIGPPRCQSPWFEEMRVLQRAPRKYRRLDAAQLIKHYLGLANTYPALPVTLLYLFWEPSNWAELPSCVQHRGEVAAFARAVSGDRVAFEWATYRNLWTDWEQGAGSRDWVMAHVAALRARYDVRVSTGAMSETVSW